jgi:hypothetical protein
MRFRYIALLSLLLVGEDLAQTRKSEFCSSRTTTAYHSPKCDWWVVHDPKRVQGIKVVHTPAYHTYSQWELAGQTYVLAYRDVDYEPQDMVADVYQTDDRRYKQIGKIEVYDLVTNVSLEKLTSGETPDLVFWSDCGQLKCIFVLRFSKSKAEKVFSYAATQIKISSLGRPRIVAVSQLANLREEFAWDSRAKEFRSTGEHPLRKEE